MTADYSSSSDVAGKLAMVVGRLNRRIRSASGELAHGSLSALATVSKSGPIRLADLAAQEFVSAPSVTRLVADLEARGLVSRSVDPIDRRAFLIEATGAGEDALVVARTKRATLVAQILGDLDDDDLRAVAAAVPALERAIEGL